jgi:ElaB/YqjD/DUF883 family membrane-anchored ribosome-binding protein
MANRQIAVSTDRLVRDLKAVVHDSEDLLKELAGELGDKGKAARERLMATLQSAKANYGEFQDRAKAGVETADAMVHEHPYTAIGIAFGVGLLAGVLVARK